MCGLCIPDYQIALYQPDSRGEESYPVGTKRKVAVGLTNKELQVRSLLLKFSSGGQSGGDLFAPENSDKTGNLTLSDAR